MDLTALNLANITTHLSEGSVSKGVAHAILFKPQGAAQGGSMGRIISLTPVRDDKTEPYTAPVPFVGGPKVTIFTSVTETTRGEDFASITRDSFTLGIFNGGLVRKVAAGTYAGAEIYNNGAAGTATGFAMRVTAAGVGKRVEIVVRPEATLRGTGVSGDTAVELAYELRGAPVNNTWTVPAALEGNATMYPWGVTIVVDYEDMQGAVELLWASAPA